MSITSAEGSGNMRVTFAGSGVTSGFANSMQVWYRGIKLAEKQGNLGHYSIEWAGTIGSSLITSIFVEETGDIKNHDINMGATNSYIEVINVGITGV